jgi:AcrR family transcriptional regulator
MALLATEGLDGVSMRRVAQALDTGPASLYVYVRNRDELVTLLIDQIAGAIALPIVGPQTDWREQLIALLLAGIKELGRYPGIAVAMSATMPQSPNALAVTDSMLALLERGGLSRQARAWAVDVLALYITAAGAEQTVQAAQGRAELLNQEVHAGARAVFADLPAEQYPHVTDLYEELTYGTIEQRTRWSIDVLINGILNTQP